jgi:hypothetical protein
MPISIENKELFIMKDVPDKCSLHPDEHINSDGLCRKCTLMGFAIKERIENGPKLSRRERADFISDIRTSLIPRVTAHVLIEMILMQPYDEERCIECASPLNEEGYCGDCTEFYRKIVFSGGVILAGTIFDEAMDACIPEFIKIEMKIRK